MIKRILVILLTASMLAGSAFAVSAKKNVTVVYVQNAKSSELKADAKHPNVLQLTLHKPESHVSYFSDRPQRLTGIVELQQFLSLWDDKSKAKFMQNPPNVAIETKKSNLIGMLSNPSYNSKTGDLTFTFTPIKPLPAEFKYGKDLGYTVLFIDDVSWDPGGFGTGG